MPPSHSKTYLITGAAGFIGARFVESCRKQGIQVISVDAQAHFSDRAEHRGMDRGTIVDRDQLMDWLRSGKPRLDAIIHLGARTDTMEMDEELLSRLNLRYSQDLWNYASQERIPYVYASSAATYGEGEFGYDDDESSLSRLKPLNPYGDSKHRFDLWALDQEKQGNHPPTWAGFKFFNVYGFGERHKGKMASVILHAYDQIRDKGSVRLFQSHRAGIGHGEQKRDFVSATDVVKVLHFALDKPIRRGIFNLGSGQARSFLDLARAVFTCLGKPEKIEFIPTPESIRERYQYFTQANMSRLKAEGYSTPFLALEQGVKEYLDRLTARSSS